MSFALIHITDIHIDNEHDQILKRTSQIVKACDGFVSDVDDAVVVVTGDLVNKGAIDQYRICCPFLKNIANNIKVKSGKDVEIITVPGNHECDFSDNHIRKIRSFLLDGIKRNEVEGFDKDLVVEAMNPQKNYFCATSDFHSLTTNEPLSRYVQLHIGEKLICFQLYNTAWISELHEQPGQLCMPIILVLKKIRNKYSSYMAGLDG